MIAENPYTHVKKMPDQAIFLGPVLSQVHVERWREQRAHLSEAFMPPAVCIANQHFTAEKAGTLLSSRASPDGVVQMNEFY